MSKARLYFTILLALYTLHAPAQRVGKIVRGTREDIVPGVRHIETNRGAREGTHRLMMIEADPRAHMVGMALATAPRAPWRGESLGSMADREQAYAAIALRTKEDQRAAPFTSGLFFAEGKLWSWPHTSGPVFSVTANESVELYEPVLDANAVATADGLTTLTIASVNGAPAQKAVIYSGPVPSGIAGWPAGTIAIPLRPDTKNSDPAGAIWNRDLTPEQRQWWPGTPVPIDKLNLGNADWALVIPPEVSSGKHSAFTEARVISLDVPLDSRVHLSLLTAQTEAWRMKEGEWIDNDNSTPGIAHYIGIDTPGRRAFLIRNGTTANGTTPFPRNEFIELLTDEGITSLAELPNADNVLLVPSEQPLFDLKRQGPETTMALMVVPRVTSLNVGGGELNRLPIAWITGSDANEAQHQPLAVLDRRINHGAELDYFWAAAGADERGAQPWLEIALTSVAQIHAIDLVHAQSAGFSPKFNLASFRILGREKNIDPWRVLATVEHDQPVERERLLLPGQTVSQIRIEVIQPNFYPESPTARLVELILWGKPAAEN